MSALQTPRINTEDAAAAAAQESSDASDDHYSSASEGGHSPIPTTRVERVDDSALHGEVPGTPAYHLRTQDAVPDEIEIVPDGRRSRSSTTTSQSRGRGLSSASASGREGGGSESRAHTPGGTPIPKTVVEKVDFEPSYGEVEGTPAKEMRMADAMPDEVRKAPEEAAAAAKMRLEGRGEEVDDDDEDEDDGRQEWLRSMWEGKAQDRGIPAQETEEEEDDDNEDDDDDDDFGDDFDEFAEGGEHDDFGDFDEGTSQPPSALPTTPDILSGLPPLDLSTCTTASEIQEAITPYITAILPNSTPLYTSIPTHQPLDTSNLTPFQSDRSLSLWQQLVSPPPMQPPNWTKSRIRRLFLVSLGVPVDLDEILPPSKQKRLVLPSIGLEGEDGIELPRPSTSAIERLREQQQGGGSGADNESSTSLDSKTNLPKRPKTHRNPHSQHKNRPPTSRSLPPPPELDLNAASLLCSTTEEALSVYSDAELKEHVFTLEVLNQKASKVLEYWLQRKDEGLKEKEALEGVIENLVGFVKGRRGR